MIVTKQIIDEAVDLAIDTFDIKHLNKDAIVAVRDDPDFVILVGWDDDAGSWMIENPRTGRRHVGAVADAFEVRGFIDFALGIRGRLMKGAGDASLADEEARFRRFIDAGGIFGKDRARLLCQVESERAVAYN